MVGGCGISRFSEVSLGVASLGGCLVLCSCVWVGWLLWFAVWLLGVAGFDYGFRILYGCSFG